MSTATRTGMSRRTAPRVLLAVLSVLAVVALSQCNMARDSVTGLNRSENAVGPGNTSAPGSCFSGCAQQANDAMKAEQQLHVQNVAACNGDPTCLANEEARHEAAVAAIQAARQTCIDGCHTQGAGRSR